MLQVRVRPRRELRRAGRCEDDVHQRAEAGHAKGEGVRRAFRGVRGTLRYVTLRYVTLRYVTLRFASCDEYIIQILVYV